MSCPYCNGEDHLWSCYWCGRVGRSLSAEARQVLRIAEWLRRKFGPGAGEGTER